MDLEPNEHYATDADKRPNIEVKKYADAAVLPTSATHSILALLEAGETVYRCLWCCFPAVLVSRLDFAQIR